MKIFNKCFAFLFLVLLLRVASFSCSKKSSSHPIYGRWYYSKDLAFSGKDTSILVSVDYSVCLKNIYFDFKLDKTYSRVSFLEKNGSCEIDTNFHDEGKYTYYPEEKMLALGYSIFFIPKQSHKILQITINDGIDYDNDGTPDLRGLELIRR